MAAALALGGSLLLRDIMYKADSIDTVLIPYKIILIKLIVLLHIYYKLPLVYDQTALW